MVLMLNFKHFELILGFTFDQIVHKRDNIIVISIKKGNLKDEQTFIILKLMLGLCSFGFTQIEKR
jgi:hypothetical protein